MPLYDNNGHYTRNPKLMQLTSGGRSTQSKDTYFSRRFPFNSIEV